MLSCAPVGKEGSATQQLGSVYVPLVGWDSPVNKLVLGGATACSAETHAAVRMGDCVTLFKGLASVEWAGLDPTVTQAAHRENMGLTVHKTVHASTMGPVTALLAPAAVLLDTMATPVNTDAHLGSLE